MAHSSDLGATVRNLCVSGRYSDALRLYASRMPFRVAVTLDNGVPRAHAIASEFAEARQVWRAGGLRPEERSFLFDELGTLAQAMGDCSQARKYFQAALDLDMTAANRGHRLSHSGYHNNVILALKRLAVLSIRSGPCDSALGFARLGLLLGQAHGLIDSVYDYHEIMAYAHFLTGNLRESERSFSRGIASRNRRSELWYLEADVRFRTGDVVQAERVIADAENRGLVLDSPDEQLDERARQQIIIARVRRSTNPGVAHKSLTDVFEWASRVGHRELSISARIALLECHPSPHLQIMLETLADAERTGYKRSAVTLHCMLAERHLSEGDAQAAYQHAKAALFLSAQICYYPGYSHALHSLGCTMLLLRSREKARYCLSEATHRLQKIRDPLSERTQSLLQSHFPTTMEEAEHVKTA